jgi:putative ABC transport system permease protein
LKLGWLVKLSWPALKHQAGRQLLALVAIALGVALSYAVHLLNTTALAEFGSAAASLNGQPDLVLRARSGPMADGVYATVAALPGVATAAPVIEGAAQALDAKDERIALRVIGLDALQSGAISPELLPTADGTAGGLNGLLDPTRVALNSAAARKLPGNGLLRLRTASADTGAASTSSWQRGGRVSATGSPLAVLDIAGAQLLLGRLGQLDRIDLRLATGLSATQWLAQTRLPSGLSAAPPPDEGARLSSLSRAYRVNLGVLSLMALFTGSFLVFAVMSLSVAQRLPQLALLGVLGMTARERAGLVLAEGLGLGVIGSVLGLALGWALAHLALQLLGADLGLSGATGVKPSLAFSASQLPAALVFGALGLAVALLSAALPALAVQRMPVAQVLKGLGSALQAALPAWVGPALLVAGVALGWSPAVAGLSIGAYVGMFLILLGGIACVPQLLRLAVGLLLVLKPSASVLLVRERARDQAGEASRALAGVLVSLSLSVAMLVMVSSFRNSLDDWLTQVLPADIYVRSSLRLSSGNGVPLPAPYIDAVRQAGLSARLAAQHSGSVLLDGAAAPIALVARDLADEARLPLVGELAAIAAGSVPIYVNEGLRDALALQPGQTLSLRLTPDGTPLRAAVRGVQRDYARQSGALLLPLADYQRWSGDTRITELYVWLTPGLSEAEGMAKLRALSAEPQDLELAAAGELRKLSLKIFDRSFAVTTWLQAVALGIGLFGIAASQSAQVLARRREFGLLLHLGFTRAGVLRLLAMEAAVLCGVGAAAGLALGLGLSAVLVFVVNPQSFHWSMDISLPLPQLAGLVAAVFIAGVGAALLAGRKAATADAVQAVKEDW